MRASARLSMRCRVSGVSGTCSEITSDVISRRSSDIASPGISPAPAATSPPRAVYATRIPNAGARDGDGSTDPAKADQPELLPAELGAEHQIERPALPLAAAHQPLAFREPSRDREDQPPGEVRDRLGQHVGRVVTTIRRATAPARRRCCRNRRPRSRSPSAAGPPRAPSGRSRPLRRQTRPALSAIRRRSSSGGIGRFAASERRRPPPRGAWRAPKTGVFA